MRYAYLAIFFVLCLNMGVLFVEGTIGPTEVVTPMNATQATDAYNASDIVENWVWTQDQGLFGDIQAGLSNIWTAFRVLVLGFPTLVESMGAPTVLSLPLKVIWSFIWVVFVAEMISGRNITGE